MLLKSMEKILLINASNRKQNTYTLLLSIERVLQNKGLQTEIIHLKDYQIDFCKGCELCVLKGKCLLKDEARQIMEKIIECDGLVIGTPVYLNNMTGILKSLIDRTCSWFHRTEVAQKPTLVLVNTQGSGIKNTVQSIQESLVQWGVCLAGSVTRSGKTFNVPIEEKEIAQFIKLIHNNGREYVPSLKELSTYNVQRALVSNVFPLDKAYWTKQEWIDSPYFPGAKVNSLKKIYGHTMYKMMRKFIKPIDNKPL